MVLFLAFEQVLFILCQLAEHAVVRCIKLVDQGFTEFPKILRTSEAVQICGYSLAIYI